MRNLLELFLPSLLLQALFSCSSCANVENDTIGNIFRNQHSKAETKKLTNIECILLIKDSTYTIGESDGEVLHQTDLQCLFDDAIIPFINMPTWLSDKMENDEIVSNSDLLQLSEVILSNEGLSIPPGAQVSVRNGENRARLAAITGSRSVIVIRSNVNFHDEYSTHTHSTSELSDMFFSTNGDAFNMRIMYEQCSYSALTFYPGTGDNVRDGVIDVVLDELPRPEDGVHLTNLLLAAAGGWSSLSSERPPYDHTVISYSPSNTNYHFRYSSNRGHWLSACAAPYCESVQFQVFSLANNMASVGYSKADNSLGNQDDLDDTGMMAGKTYTIHSSDPNGPLRCFNAVRNWSFGWYSDRHATIESGQNGLYKVVGLTDYQTTNDVIVILITGESLPIFVSYNRKKSFNSGTGEGGDRVLVHTKEANHHPLQKNGESLLVAILASGESTTILGNLISCLNIEADHALVEINTQTPPPTTAPTPSTSPPTSSPTTSPTSWSKSPTQAPTSSPTSWSKSPTQAPTSSPTNLSKSPTTQAPTPGVCLNTPGWKFVKKNGKEKGCNWFGKRAKRCLKKVGGMENCPVSCDVCEKSGRRLCEKSDLRKKVCKSISCCTWDNDSKSCKSNVGNSKCF